ncbi:nucleotidyltransferase domain-containing protein, partial [Nocardiopsis lucentensis]|uniref:nucleotidyltransferase domain-containing protein n=1 Tax=Nocardiopsis lucentensis TaxID=53441 RepID=UPI0003650D99
PPAVSAVSLGGSRAQGSHRPDSDWDLAVYYRGAFDPQTLRDVGWEGEVSEIGGWGGGVFNGGARLRIDGRRVDVHYRDLADVEYRLAEARRGRFGIEPLVFHLAGIPTYLVVAELALGRVLVGDLPRPDYPEALRASAPPVWRGLAAATLAHAERDHAPYGRVAQCAGLVAQAASQAAHAVLAARGEWVTNDKTLLSRAGLEEVDLVVAGMTADPQDLAAAVAEVGRIIATA